MVADRSSTGCENEEGMMASLSVGRIRSRSGNQRTGKRKSHPAACENIPTHDESGPSPQTPESQIVSQTPNPTDPLKGFPAPPDRLCMAPEQPVEVEPETRRSPLRAMQGSVKGHKGYCQVRV